VFAFTIVIVGKAMQSRIKYAEGKVIIWHTSLLD
jgi:hypothetical protein